MESVLRISRITNPKYDKSIRFGQTDGPTTRFPIKHLRETPAEIVSRVVKWSGEVHSGGDQTVPEYLRVRDNWSRCGCD